MNIKRVALSSSTSPIFNMPSPVVVVSTVLSLGLLYAYQRWTKRVAPTIPYAGSPTASRDPTILERLQAAGEYAKDPVAFLCKTRSILGDVFCVDLIIVKFVFMLGSERNREILRAPESKLSFEHAIRWSLGPIVSHLFEVQGFSEAAMRVLRAALLRQECLDGYLALCKGITEQHLEQWERTGTVPLFESVSNVVIANMIMLLLGEANYNRYAEELIPKMAQFERDMQKPILRLLPWSLWRFSSPGRSLFETVARFNQICTEDTLDILANPSKHASREDYLYSLVMQLGKDMVSCYGAHTMSIVFAGHANAAMSIPWLFLHARRTPGAIDKIRAELALPASERRPYLEACLRETGRLYTNTSMMRMAMEDVHVTGHVIPAGTLVAGSPAATQRVEASEAGGIYENAEKWDPTRFLADAKVNGETQPGTSAYTRWFQRAEFVQFGLGQHACPGEKMARMLIFDFILKTWMQNYDVEVVSGVHEGEKGIDGVGAEGAWTEENFGTPNVRGEDVMIHVKRRK